MMMIRSFLNSRNVIRNRTFSTLVATEEFPFNATIIPHKPSPAVVSETRLDNGVKVITRDTHSPIVSLKFAIMGGSRSELPHQKGAAHFLSIAAYSGNKKNSGLRLIRFLESLGTSIKASADREKIVYEVSVLADRVEPVVAGVLTAISSPPHASYVLEEAKETAELFYSSLSTDYPLQLQELLHEAAYGEVSPLGSSRFATNAKKIDVDSVLEFRSNNFVSGNLVVTANGISQDKLKSILLLHGDLLPNGPASPVVPSPYTGGQVRQRVDLDGQTHLGVAFPVPSGEAGRPYAVLAEYLSSRGVEVHLWTTGGGGGLLALTTSGTVEEAIRGLEKSVGELKEVGKSSLKGAKSRASLKGLDSVDVILVNLSEGLSSVSDLREVSDESVKEAAKRLLKETVPSYAVLGKTAGSPSYSDIVKLLL